MTRLVNFWNPWQELDRVREEFGRYFPPQRGPARKTPPVNLAEGEHSVVLTTELPGLNLEDIEVTVAANTVTLRANRPETQLQDGENWLVHERSAGSVERSIELPFEVDTANVDAAYENGVLTLRLQRPEAQRPRKVAIRSV